MPDLTDLSVAQAAVTNPATTPADLALITQHHPSLRIFVARHPGAYPALLDWLDGLGDPALSAAVQERRAALTQPSPTPTAPVPQTSLPPTPVFTQPVSSPQSPDAPGLTASSYTPQVGTPPYAPQQYGQEQYAPAPTKKRSRKLLIVIIGCVVVVALLIVGFVVILPKLTSSDHWANTFGGSKSESFSSVAIADNGDIIAVGYTDSTDGEYPKTHGPDNQDAVIARFTPTGDLIWAHSYGGSGYDFFTSVAVASNGDIITTGYTFSTDGDFPVRGDGFHRDALIARFTSTGDLIWAQALGGDDEDYFQSVTVAGDGDSIAVGYTYSTDGDFPISHGGSNPDAVIARFTTTGDIVWAQTYGGDSYDSFESVAVADNGDIIATGVTMSIDGDFPGTNESSDAVIARLTSTGDIVWAHALGGSSEDLFVSVAVADNGDIIATGVTLSIDGDFPGTHAEDTVDAVIARFTGDGDLLWTQVYGGNDDDFFQSVALASNGDIVIAGYTYSTDGDFPGTHGEYNRDAVVARFTATGERVWIHVYGGSGADYFSSVVIADNGDIIATGFTESTDGDFPGGGDENRDALIARLTKSGDLT